MAIEVAKVELKTVQDASGMAACIEKGQFTADQVVAVIGKTEGNGGVNDFTRILADQAFRRILMKLGSRAERHVAQIPMVWSGGCDGVITPHATVFARKDKTGSQSKSRLTLGTAMSAELLPEDIGRPAMVEKVAAGVKAAMQNAGIQDPADVHYVQTKTPLLTIESVRDAQSRGGIWPAKFTTPWECQTAPRRLALRLRWARRRCLRPRRCAAISAFIRRWPRARPASN